MKIVALKESAKGEKRVAITPETAKLLIQDSHEVVLEKEAGVNSGFLDSYYEKAGVQIEVNKAKILKDADIILTVQALDQKDLKHIKEQTIQIGLLSPYFNKGYLELCAII